MAAEIQELFAHGAFRADALRLGAWQILQDLSHEGQHPASLQQPGAATPWSSSGVRENSLRTNRSMAAQRSLLPNVQSMPSSSRSMGNLELSGEGLWNGPSCQAASSNGRLSSQVEGSGDSSPHALGKMIGHRGALASGIECDKKTLALWRRRLAGRRGMADVAPGRGQPRRNSDGGCHAVFKHAASKYHLSMPSELQETLHQKLDAAAEDIHRTSRTSSPGTTLHHYVQNALAKSMLHCASTPPPPPLVMLSDEPSMRNGISPLLTHPANRPMSLSSLSSAYSSRETELTLRRDSSSDDQDSVILFPARHTPLRPPPPFIDHEALLMSSPTEPEPPPRVLTPNGTPPHYILSESKVTSSHINNSLPPLSRVGPPPRTGPIPSSKRNAPGIRARGVTPPAGPALNGARQVAPFTVSEKVASEPHDLLLKLVMLRPAHSANSLSMRSILKLSRPSLLSYAHGPLVPQPRIPPSPRSKVTKGGTLNSVLPTVVADCIQPSQLKDASEGGKKAKTQRVVSNGKPPALDLTDVTEIVGTYLSPQPCTPCASAPSSASSAPAEAQPWYLSTFDSSGMTRQLDGSCSPRLYDGSSMAHQLDGGGLHGAAEQSTSRPTSPGVLLLSSSPPDRPATHGGILRGGNVSGVAVYKQRSDGMLELNREYKGNSPGGLGATGRRPALRSAPAKGPSVACNLCAPSTQSRIPSHVVKTRNSIFTRVNNVRNGLNKDGAKVETEVKGMSLTSPHPPPYEGTGKFGPEPKGPTAGMEEHRYLVRPQTNSGQNTSRQSSMQGRLISGRACTPAAACPPPDSSSMQPPISFLRLKMGSRGGRPHPESAHQVTPVAQGHPSQAHLEGVASRAPLSPSAHRNGCSSATLPFSRPAAPAFAGHLSAQQRSQIMVPAAQHVAPAIPSKSLSSILNSPGLVSSRKPERGTANGIHPKRGPSTQQSTRDPAVGYRSFDPPPLIQEVSLEDIAVANHLGLRRLSTTLSSTTILTPW